MVEFDDGDYFSGQPQSPTTPKSPPKTLKTRRRKRDRSVSSSKGPIPVPQTPIPADTTGKSVPPIFQLLGSITGRATDLYNSWARPAAGHSQPPRRGSAATSTSYLTSSAFNSSNPPPPLMKDMMMSPELQPLPSLLSVPVNAPPTPPGDLDMAKFKIQTQTQTQTQTKKSSTTSTPKIALPSVANIRHQVLQQASQYSNTFLSSPLLLAGAAVIVGLAITVGRPLLEIYIHKGIHYVFNFIFYATVTAAVATIATVAWMLIRSKMKGKTPSVSSSPVAVKSVAASPVAPTLPAIDTDTPMPDLSRRSSKRRSSRRASASTSASAQAPPPPMMYPPYGYQPQQQWDEYNYPGHPSMNMYMPPPPMYQPQLFHPVPVRPFEPPQSTAAATPVTPSAQSFPVTPGAPTFPLPPTPGHARTESGNVAAIPEILQQPKKKPVYRVVQRKVEREWERETPRPPLRTRELPPVPREPPQVPKHQGLPAVFTRFEDENSMVNYASPISEVDLKVGDHSFKPYGSPPRRFHGMNV